MAINYESHQIASDRDATPLVITKPTGLAVGDLMVAYLSCNNGSGAGSWTLPGGWTSIESSGTTPYWVAIFAKLADASDVSASNFSFSSSPAGDSVGILLRISGDFNSTLSITDSVLNMSGITTTGVTPVVGGALFMFGSIDNASTSAGIFSGYSIVTSNPTWTEIVDGRYDDLREIHYFVAWALRSQTTATGNSSVTFSSGGDAQYGGALISIVESVGANGNHPILTSTSDVFNSGLSVGTTASHTILEMTSTIHDSTSSILQGSEQWVLDSKNTGNWTLDNKS